MAWGFADEEIQEVTLKPVDLTPTISRALTASINHVVDEVLEERHYKQLGVCLAKQWDRQHSLSAAMMLMEEYGVHVSPEEEARLRSMDEMKVIDVLVSKMPETSKEEFQTFFLKLQQIVATAMQVHQALREGRSDVVKAALETAEASGIAHFILKMTMAQAGSLVIERKELHEAWVQEAQAKLSKLVRSQDEAMQAKLKLAGAQAELSYLQGKHRQKAGRVLVNLVGESSASKLRFVFSSWAAFAGHEKKQAGIYDDEYRDMLERAEERLVQTQTHHLHTVRGVLNRRSGNLDRAIVEECFDAMKSLVDMERKSSASREQLRCMEHALKARTDLQAERARSLMTKMGASLDSGLIGLCWQAWVGFHEHFQMNKDMEVRVREVERKVSEFAKTKTKMAGSVLDRMGSAFTSGLALQCFKCWYQHVQDELRADQMVRQLKKSKDRLSIFADRNSHNAKGAMERCRTQVDVTVTLRVFMAWRLHARLEQVLLQHNTRLDGKRVQLQNVQVMFKDFARQLETGLTSSPDSDRDLRNLMKTRKTMSKSEGTMSLPNIHKQGLSKGGLETLPALQTPKRDLGWSFGRGHSGPQYQKDDVMGMRRNQWG